MNTKRFQWASALLFLALFAFSACSDDDNDVKKFTLTVNVGLPDGVSADDLRNLKVVVTGNRTSDTLDLTSASQAITLVQGSYTLSASGKLASEATAFVNGKASVDLYDSNKSVTVNLEKIYQSSLIFKAIYTTGGQLGYMFDGYFEIVNNSDEVQYLDGVVLSAPQGNQTQPNAWQADGITDRYECGQGQVWAFPGNGTDYPLQPGESVVIANYAANHSELAPEGNACPDLSGADWELYNDNMTGRVDVANVPNLDMIFQNNVYMKVFGLGFFGRSYILARMPEGVTPTTFAADSANIMTTPGTTSTTPYLMIPSTCVLDAVDIQDPDSETHYGTFLAKDDQQCVLASAAWAGKCIRRRVVEIKDGRPYYQDTNNSSADFLNNQPLTPGQTPAVAD